MWLLSGPIAVSLVDSAVEPAELRDALDRSPYLLDDLVSFLVLGGGISLALSHWIPGLVAACLAVAVGMTPGVVGRIGATGAGRWASR